MDINNIYYVYAYLDDDNEPYYIGKGKERRAYVRYRTGPLAPTDHSKIAMVASELTERTAFTYERILIQHYGRIDIGTGILYNKTNGGQGNAGSIRVVTEATKIKTRNTILALRQQDAYVSASCIHCRKVITTAVEVIELNINQHIYYKHKNIACNWAPKTGLIPVSCIRCRKVLKSFTGLDIHYKTHMGV